MKPILMVILLPVLLAGCISYTDTSPGHTTVVVPPAGTTVVCGAGSTAPC